MKKTFKIFMAISLTVAFAATAYAHPGRLDKNGGHKVHAEGHGYPVGSYHYHYGSNRDTAYDAQGNVIQKNTVIKTITPIFIEEPEPTSTPSNTETNLVNQITVIVAGEIILFDQPPENINGRIMVPIRYVVEEMGCTVEWDNDTQTVYINESDTAIEKTAIKTENINVYVNNEAIIFEDQQPVNKNGRILIPVRFVTEKLGYNVEWDEMVQAVYIDKAN